MTTLFSLFSSEADVTKAIDTLSKQVPDAETRVISSETELRGTKTPIAIGSPLPGVTGAPVVNVTQEKISEMAMNDDEADFYLRGLRSGGALLVVQTDDEQSEAVRNILRTENGRWPNQS